MNTNIFFATEDTEGTEKYKILKIKHKIYTEKSRAQVTCHKSKEKIPLVLLFKQKDYEPFIRSGEKIKILHHRSHGERKK
jgi:hypothetical protein